MRVRYSGSDEARDLAVPGGLLHCPRGEWVDLDAKCAEANIPVVHLEVVALGLADAPDWKVDGWKAPARKPRRAKAAKADPAPEAAPVALDDTAPADEDQEVQR